MFYSLMVPWRSFASGKFNSWRRFQWLTQRVSTENKRWCSPDKNGGTWVFSGLVHSLGKFQKCHSKMSWGPSNENGGAVEITENDTLVLMCQAQRECEEVRLSEVNQRGWCLCSLVDEDIDVIRSDIYLIVWSRVYSISFTEQLNGLRIKCTDA